jgi:hypothetical protein
MEQYDKVIIRGTVFGIILRKIGATYINQAHVHQGYHYPRSISTAMKSAGYFERFNKDYNFCIIENLTKFMQHPAGIHGRMEYF